jgi:hypothetical protein
MSHCWIYLGKPFSRAEQGSGRQEFLGLLKSLFFLEIERKKKE